jgi:integrase
MQFSPTFEGIARNMLDHSSARAGTVRGYHTLLGHCMPSLGSMPVKVVARRHVEAALAAARSKGLAPKSVRNLLQFIRMVLAEAGSRAADGLRIRVPDADVRAMTREEAARFVDVLTSRDGKVSAALYVLLRTGLRLGELLALTRNDWDYGQGQLHVQRSVNGPTKSGRRRTVDVPDDASSWLNAAATLVDHSGLLFPICDRTLRRRMAAACVAAGIPQFRVHDLRHTRITHMLLASVPVAYVSEQAGHASPSYTMRVYGHVAAASSAQRREWANA